MIMDSPSENQDMAGQFTAPQHAQAAPSQQSSEIEMSSYEAADQLETRCHNRQGSENAENGGLADQEMTSDLASRLHDELNSASGQPELEGESRRSSSQEQALESHYSPISVAPVNGQMCR